MVDVAEDVLARKKNRLVDQTTELEFTVKTGLKVFFDVLLAAQKIEVR